MTQGIIALATAGVCACLPMTELGIIERIVCVVSIYLCVRFFISDFARIIRRYRKQKGRERREKDDFAGMLMKATLPGKQHTLSIDTLRRTA